jgi:hypothetical protein
LKNVLQALEARYTEPVQTKEWRHFYAILIKATPLKGCTFVEDQHTLVVAYRFVYLVEKLLLNGW